MMQLVVRTGPKMGQVFPMEDRPIRLGRDSSSTIRIDDSKASREHAVLEPTEDGTWIIRDLQSTNHTYLNGEEITTAVLKEGDMIRIGSTEIALTGATIESPDVSIEMSQHSLEMVLRSDSDVRTGTSLQEALFRIGHLNDPSREPDDFLRQSLDVMRDCISFSNWVWIDWPDGPNGKPRVRSNQRASECDEYSSSSLVLRALKHRTGFLGNNQDVAEARSHSGSDLVISSLAIPLQSGESLDAVLYLDRLQGERPFERDHLERLAALASHVHLDLKNILLFRQLESAFEELNQSQEDLVRTEKMAGIGRLASGFAHDLNNPLSSVIGFLDLGLKSLAKVDASTLPPKLRHYMERAHDAADYCRALSRNLLAFARQDMSDENKKTIEYNASEAIESTLNICHASLQRSNARAEISIPAGVMLQGDPSSLKQVIMNLVTNAADALSELDEVHEGVIWVKGTQIPEGLQLIIRDNGPGIPEEIRDKIFDPLFTTKPQDRGTGLGLFVVKRIVEESGGTLTVDSQMGKGTMFTLFLPTQVHGLKSEEEPTNAVTLVDFALPKE